ncbi:sigma factor G inhibitor Gin [Desulfosporosinus sp. PR]|uniref:sigma factor G inhibitor Gin n=1 Tax=Candidatus Desulfosporosinus nitrosoreducens TaxID=3401928 RepID=UPI0027FCD508|nr:sigma factor G inhibitor Gin [Desulfosporosinus sp. PR]MDQ7092760.1 sigma factor G inhibitor Gin [Desulfosporosinus sp. PR]
MIKTIHTLNRFENTKKDSNQEIALPKGKVLPVCYRCAQVPQNGLYDGFRVRGMFFCSDCQQELCSAEQGTPEYQEFLFLIQGLLF